MDSNEDHYLYHNKLLEESLDYCIHTIESRLDKLYGEQVDAFQSASDVERNPNKTTNPFSISSFLQFKAPYIRDFKNFSGPANKDVRQIKELSGTEDIHSLLRNKDWTKEHRQQLKNAVLDHYAQIHIATLIKQKNILAKQLKEASPEEKSNIEQNLNLIEEQTEQVKARKEERIFVPSKRIDENIDWLAISAKLSSSSHDAQDCRLMWSNRVHWSINDNQWTKEEDMCLLKAVEKYGKNDWDSVSNELNSNRLSWQCCSRYHQEFAHAHNSSKSMSCDDMERIIEIINLCRIGNYVPWNQVMYFVQYHSLLQVKYQWHKLLSDKKSSQPWSHQEDVLLLNLVEKFGERDWGRIANYIPGRTNKSCRERFMMRLRFGRRAIGSWKRKEDETLTSLIDRYGTNWSLISTYLPERNNHQIRNRYELLKKEASRVGPIKHRKIYRNEDGFLIRIDGRRQRPCTDREIDRRLYEIFSSYQTVKSTTKSLVCRSLQDELIYQSLVRVTRSIMTGRDLDHNFLNLLIEKALKSRVCFKYELFTPCVSTIRGYRGWMMQQDYLNQFVNKSTYSNEFTGTDEYRKFLKVIMSLFLWPAILGRVKTPEVDADCYQVRSIIEKDRKNLYKIIGVQKQVISHGTM